MRRSTLFERALALLAVGVVAATASPALAAESCEVDGKPINLSDGSATRALTGLVRCHDDDHKPTRELPYKNGKQDGWYKDLRSLWGHGPSWIEYRAGEKTGCRKVFSKTGAILEEATCQGGHPLVEKYFWPDGTLKQRATHRGAKGDDVFRVRYDAKGRISELSCGSTSEMRAGVPSCPYARETTVVTTYYPSGAVKAVWPFKSGLLDGRAEDHRRDGTLEETTEYRAGVRAGVVQTFDPNGKLRRSTTWSGKVRDGEEKTYFPQGQQASVLDWSHGDLDRARISYQNGKLRLDLRRDGTRVKAQGYWDLGKPQFEGQFLVRSAGDFERAVEQELPDAVPSLDDWLGYGGGGLVPVGVQQTFFESGEVSGMAHYDDAGKRQGTLVTYFPNGKLELEATFQADVLVAKKTYDKSGALTLDETYFPDGSRKSKRK